MSPSSGPTSNSSSQKSTLSVRSLSGEPQTPDQIEAEIEVQREQLAETIDALSAKLDVKSQAQARIEEVKQTAQSKVAQLRQTAQATIGSAQTRVGAAQTRVGSASGTPRPELLAFGVTVMVATAVLWWRER